MLAKPSPCAGVTPAGVIPILLVPADAAGSPIVADCTTTPPIAVEDDDAHC